MAIVFKLLLTFSFIVPSTSPRYSLCLTVTWLFDFLYYDYQFRQLYHYRQRADKQAKYFIWLNSTHVYTYSRQSWFNACVHQAIDTVAASAGNRKVLTVTVAKYMEAQYVCSLASLILPNHGLVSPQHRLHSWQLHLACPACSTLCLLNIPVWFRFVVFFLLAFLHEKPLIHCPASSYETFQDSCIICTNQ